MKIDKEVIKLIFSLGLEDHDQIWNIKYPHKSCPDCHGEGINEKGNYCNCLLEKGGEMMKFGDFKKIVKKSREKSWFLDQNNVYYYYDI